MKEFKQTLLGYAKTCVAVTDYLREKRAAPKIVYALTLILHAQIIATMECIGLLVEMIETIEKEKIT